MIARPLRLMLLFSSGFLSAGAFASQPSYTLNGYLEEEIGDSYQHDDFQLSKILTTANVNLDVNFNPSWKAKVNLQGSYDAAYSVEGREEFSDETLDVYEKDVRLNEAYTDIDVNSWMNIRAGRQYFSWGESNSEQITDIGNPRNLRELGLQNVKDLRLPVGATKITFYDASWEYSVIALHEVRSDELGAKGSEFDPFLAAREQITIRDVHEPKSNFSNTGFLSRLFISQEWGDISFIAGRKYENFPLLEFQSANLTTREVVFNPEFKKVNTFGTFGNIIRGSWQLKFDVAETKNKPFGRSVESVVQQLVSGSNQPIISWQNHDVLKAMLGIEYSGFSNSQISVEFINQHIKGYQPVLMDKEDVRKISIYLSRSFLNESINTSLWMNHLLKDDTNLFRFDVSYIFNDAIKYFVSFSGVSGAKSGTYYTDYLETDRIAVGIKYGF